MMDKALPNLVKDLSLNETNVSFCSLALPGVGRFDNGRNHHCICVPPVKHLPEKLQSYSGRGHGEFQRILLCGTQFHSGLWILFWLHAAERCFVSLGQWWVCHHVRDANVKHRWQKNVKGFPESTVTWSETCASTFSSLGARPPAFVSFCFVSFWIWLHAHFPVCVNQDVKFSFFARFPRIVVSVFTSQNFSVHSGRRALCCWRFFSRRIHLKLTAKLSFQPLPKTRSPQRM